MTHRVKAWKMKVCHASLRGLTIHYLKGLRKTFALLKERISGVVAFVSWGPLLIRKTLPIFRRTLSARPVRRASPTLGEIPTFFINLEHRKDRRKLTENELRMVGLDRNTRFPAISNSPGILGCTQSHVGVMEKIQRLGHPFAIICEDDVQFLSPREEIEKLIDEFIVTPELDVLCLAYRLRAPRLRVTSHLAVANHIQTAACYMVKSQALPSLIKSFKESEDMLAKGISSKVAANDMHWKTIQRDPLLFCVPLRPGARQRPSYSDIVQKFKDYGIS